MKRQKPMILLVVLCLLSGCGLSEPDLTSSPWTKVVVRYSRSSEQPGTDGRVPPYTDHVITDVGELSKLQVAYSVRDMQGLTVGFDSKWGEVEVHTANEVWVLEFKDRDSATMHPLGSYDAVYAVELDPAFAESLRMEVIAQTGDGEAQFYRPVDVPAVLSN